MPPPSPPGLARTISTLTPVSMGPDDMSIATSADILTDQVIQLMPGWIIRQMRKGLLPSVWTEEEAEHIFGPNVVEKGLFVHCWRGYVTMTRSLLALSAADHDFYLNCINVVSRHVDRMTDKVIVSDYIASLQQ